MRIIRPSATLEKPEDLWEGHQELKRIERAGRTCYKSESEYTVGSAVEFIRKIIKLGHESVLEHGSATVRFITNRGCSHEIVRHRLASYSQESTRYCNYSKDRFGQEITVIEPDLSPSQFQTWRKAMQCAENQYFQLLASKVKPQIARGVLPIDLKTELVMTANFREWRHFFKLRTAGAAHPQLRQITQPLLQVFREHFPAVFDDVGVINE